jgi:AbrB family looped-hinge helix DNA binding protein
LEIVHLSSTGQITLPLSIRKMLNLEEGDRLTVSLVGTELHLRKIEKPNVTFFTQKNSCHK